METQKLEFIEFLITENDKDSIWSKTRWNSLFAILGRFFLLSNFILKSLIDLKS